ncbi:MAG: amidohydrolase family protein [Planctomycetota bacterium]
METPVPPIATVFDAHFHIIDPRFPLQENHGYLPEPFTVTHYLDRMAAYERRGGAVVSGSFQAFDQSYLLDALDRLGPDYVGVTQLPADVSDNELLRLDEAGVRALRFNLRRGGSATLDQLEPFARRVFDFVGWHTELYVDAKELHAFADTIRALPIVSVDHLGLSRAGLPLLTSLVEEGVYVKATGFGRVDFDVVIALRQLSEANPHRVLFGTDLPSTRAPVPYRDTDVETVIDAVGVDQAQRIFSENGIALYRRKPRGI